MITFGSVCSGIEAASVAWHRLGWRAAWLAEIEPHPCKVLHHHYGAGRPLYMPDPAEIDKDGEPLDDDTRKARAAAIRSVAWLPIINEGLRNLGDFTKIADLVRKRLVSAPDVLVGGTPCFTAGHMVLCADGYRPIESIVAGDMVVTHTGHLHRVIRIGQKVSPVGKLAGVGMAPGLVTTGEHPFLAVNFHMQSTKRKNVYAKIEHCDAPEWTEAQHMVGKNWCALTQYTISPQIIRSSKFDDKTSMYLAGMYLGDGYVREWGGASKKAVVFCLNKAKSEKFKSAAPGAGTFATESRGAIKVTVNDTVFANWLIEQFGELSHGKRIPAWVMGHEFSGELLRGYLDTDGGITDNGFVANSVSHALALGISDLANCNGYSAGLAFVKTPDTCVIEGRTVNQRDYWSVKAVHSERSRKSRVRHGYLLRRMQSYTPGDIDTVFNIEVEGDNSYVVNGAVVHNCQAFSIAGLRNSMGDARGQLTLSFVDLANAIDTARSVRGEPPAIIVWENVPGVLSTADNAFGCFLGALAGEDDPLIAPGGKWANAGCVFGPQRTVAWRVTDAQYFGVPQRRRRVFVVASAREGFNPAEILFEFDGVRRDSPPSRETGQDVTGTISSRTSGGGGLGTDFDLAGGLQPVVGTLQANGKAAGSATQQDAESGMLVPVAYGGNNTAGSIDVATACRAHESPHLDFESETFLVQPARPIAFDSRQDCVSSTELFGALGCSSPQAQAVAIDIRNAKIERDGPTMSLQAGGMGEGRGMCINAIPHTMSPVCITGDITHTLKAEGFDASEDGTGRGQPIVGVDISHSLTAARGAACALDPSRETYPIQGMAVRRLLPIECEALQSFPPNYTLVPTKKITQARAETILAAGDPAVLIDGQWWEQSADGPRYKALGNSMCTEQMHFIGKRIAVAMINRMEISP